MRLSGRDGLWIPAHALPDRPPTFPSKPRCLLLGRLLGAYYGTTKARSGLFNGPSTLLFFLPAMVPQGCGPPGLYLMDRLPPLSF